MTKGQWREILEELKTIRSTNKFKTGRLVYLEGYNEGDKEIDRISVEELFIRFVGREYITHDHVLNVKPWDMRSRFRISINPLDVDTIKFKRR